ncbi:MAG: hypothetical protein RL678_1, partial [Pseudomonadota bacterium]
SLAIHIQRLDTALGIFLNTLGASLCAAGATIVTHIVADEYMMLVIEITHGIV